MEHAYDDGGRAQAGYKGTTDDCVTRAIAIAAELPYQEVYDALFALGNSSPRGGVSRRVYDRYLSELGWTWVPTMHIGSGCRVHLRAEELPAGRLIVRLSKHVCAVVDGVVHDTHNPSRDGTRCVYGYWHS
jgi:hypothetical protein